MQYSWMQDKLFWWSKKSAFYFPNNEESSLGQTELTLRIFFAVTKIRKTDLKFKKQTKISKKSVLQTKVCFYRPRQQHWKTYVADGFALLIEVHGGHSFGQAKNSLN